MEICFADAQTTVFAFQATARHPGGSISFRSFGELCWLGAALGGRGCEGGSHPTTGLFSMHGGCQAAGGAAAVVFIVVHRSHSTAEGAIQEVWRAAHGPFWSRNFSLRSSFYTAILLPHFIMLDAGRPVLDPGGKESISFPPS